MKILLVEDSEVDARITRQRLRRMMDADLSIVDTLAAAQVQASAADLVLADLNLPDSEPMDTIDRLVATGHPRLVFFSSDEALRAHAVQAGARVISKDDADEAWAQALL